MAETLEMTEDESLLEENRNSDESAENNEERKHSKIHDFQLHSNVKGGQVNVVRELLKKGNDSPFKQDFKGNTPLHYAASYRE